MDTPTTAVGAVGVLVDAGTIPAPDVDVTDTATAWQALDYRRRWPATVRRRHRAMEEGFYLRHGMDVDAPPVLTTLPPDFLPHGWVHVTGDPSPRALGLTGRGIGRLSERVAAPGRRRRLALVADPKSLTPSPQSALLLAAAALGARATGAHLVRYAPHVLARERRLVGREVDAAEAYATQAEALIPAAFGGWLEAATSTTTPGTPSTVPAVIRVGLDTT